jgi:hypothetical protein
MYEAEILTRPRCWKERESPNVCMQTERVSSFFKKATRKKLVEEKRGR